MDLLTDGSYRSPSGRLVGTNCPACGGSTGAGGWFCDGYAGPHDWRMCTCRCHDRTDLLTREDTDYA